MFTKFKSRRHLRPEQLVETQPYVASQPSYNNLPPPRDQRHYGTIKNFFPGKGYGFIRSNDTDIFFQAKRRPEVGAKVSFRMIRTDRGPRATNILLDGQPLD